MRTPKSETLSIRTSAEVKLLLRLAAEREHRSISSMLEVLIREHANKLGLQAQAATEDPGSWFGRGSGR
ncbi:MAG: hypothetical protein ACOVPA_00495 [Rubrivivax sp.]|jgi:uncharacterized protein (DUF1778 family)